MLAREGLEAGSSPIGCVIVDGSGTVIAEGRNRSGEPWPTEPHRIGDSGFAHAEMDAFFRLGRVPQPQECTLYSSMEPCLMCGGAVAMTELGRVVWACDDPWGGSGRLIEWDQHPAFRGVSIVPAPFADLEQEAATLFAVEARSVYPPEGWQRWRERYAEICERVEQLMRQIPDRTRKTHGAPPTRPNEPTLD